MTALAPHDRTHVQFVLLASLWWLADHEPEPPTQARLAEQLVARALADVERADAEYFAPLADGHEPFLDALAVLSRMPGGGSG